MITTVTLNPCIDYTMNFSSVQLGALNLANSVRQDPSGKGLNVSRVLHQLGIDTMATGFGFEGGMELIYNTLRQEGVPFSFLPVLGQVRMNVKAIDQNTGELTELNDRGTQVSVQNIADLLLELKKLAVTSDFLVLGGRIPKNAPSSLYADLMKELSDCPCPIVLDADGEGFRLGVAQKPYLIKPNRFELEQLLGTHLPTQEALFAGVNQLHEQGVRYVCVSLGSEGAILSSKEEKWCAPAIPITVGSTVGAGDSMLGGLCAGLQKQLPLSECLRWGVAASAGTVRYEGTKLCQKEDFQELLEKTQVYPYGGK